MPLLPLEPFVYPDDLLTQPAPDGEGATRWWVLHTRPRAEKALARKLGERRTPFFLPLYERQWRTKGRLFKSHIPLFPGYIFLQSDEEGRQQTVETNMVVRWLPVSDQPRLHADLAQLHRLIRTDSLLTPEENLPPGTIVEITAGPLSGLKGTVLRRAKKLRIIIEVQILQRGVSVEIEASMIQSAEK
jgi:transcription antitermination factor NusG